MDLREFYTEVQGDYNEACKRMINEQIAGKFVRKFPSDPTMAMLREAIAAGDIELSFRAVHTLKGLTANLAFSKLFEAAWELTEQLRPRLEPADAELFAALEEEYQHTIDAIAKLS